MVKLYFANDSEYIFYISHLIIVPILYVYDVSVSAVLSLLGFNTPA